MAKKFECRREIVLPASPEEVWQAVATAQGNEAWLFTNEIDESGAGAVAWEPPHHFAVRTEQGDWFNALEFEIEARGGGTSVLRYVHSGIFVDDWDTQYDAVQQHTDFYLHTLAAYLEHFKGRAATYVGDGSAGIVGPTASAAPDGFIRMKQALGLTDSVAEGDAVRLTPEGLEPVDGVVDYVREHFLGVRSADALYRFFGRNAFGAPVGMSIHVFAGEVDASGVDAGEVDADAVKRSWQRWMTEALG